MRVVIQRVLKAEVSINETIHSTIDQGYLLLLGISDEDTTEDADYIVKKISALRIFNDLQGKMNLSIEDTNGQILLISQFTLFAETKKGNRPGFTHAARPEQAIPLYEYVKNSLILKDIHVKTGVFGADMQVSLINDGPVTIIIDSKQRDY